MINRLKKYALSFGNIFLGIMMFLVVCFFKTLHVAADTEQTIEKKSGMVPFVWVVAVVGGCIAVTLSYVGWRKYKGEEKSKHKQDKTVD